MIVLSLGLTYSLHADTILDANSFTSSQPSGGGFVVATSTFNLSSGQIADVLFEADFSLVDAGIEIVVNNTVLFSTGNDVSNFGPQVFAVTADQPDNIDFSFSPNQNGLPRLSLSADTTGTSFSGAAFVNSTTVVDYDPLFAVANFNSLLQSGTNTIEIVNLNSFEGASLAGDYSVTVVAQAIPEPTTLSVLLAGGLLLSSRRRRK